MQVNPNPNSPIVDAYVKANSFGGFNNFGYDANHELREVGFGKIQPQRQKTILDFDAEFTTLYSTCNSLYRATSLEVLGNPNPGDRIEYPAFMSCSTRIGSTSGIFLNRVLAGETKVLLKVGYRQGEPCIDPVSALEEAEVILPRNCAFKVSAWNPDAGESDLLGLFAVGAQILELSLV